MSKASVEMPVADLDGSEAVATVRLGWNGEWREHELSDKNLAGLSKAIDRFRDVARPVGNQAPRRRNRRPATATRPTSRATRDPKPIRA